MNKDNNALPVCMRTMSVSAVLSYKLEIPQYQRAYVWRRKTVSSFITDIVNWMHRNIEDPERTYHLGCIILKAKKDPLDSSISYDIVDGQQRLVTLALWARQIGLDDRKNSLIAKPIRGGVDAIKRAREICKKSKISEADLSRLQMSVLEISEDAGDDLAYAFFDNTNTLGKKLSDYDLLKTHHLRYLRDDVDGGCASRFCAQRWNLLAAQNVGDVELQKCLLNDCLYRIRQWSGRGGIESFPINGDSFDRTLYHHFSSSVDDSVGSSFETKTPQEVERMIVGGMPFFEYVEFYRSRFVQFIELPAVVYLRECLSGHSKGVVCKAVIATAFVAYCRFGDWYIADIICALAFAISQVRCRSSVQERMLTWHTDGMNLIDGGWGGYMGRITHRVLHAPTDIALVELLHDEAFQYSVPMEQKHNAKSAYWKSLKDFLSKCPGRQIQSDYYTKRFEG